MKTKSITRTIIIAAIIFGYQFGKDIFKMGVKDGKAHEHCAVVSKAK